MASQPQHDLAVRKMRNCSGMVFFVADDGPALARRFVDRLKTVACAVSPGKTRNLLFYISTDDLIADLAEALG